jgi:FkbM family methyltransferase
MRLSDRLMNVLRRVPVRKHRLLSPFFPANGERWAKVHGVMMELDLSDLIQRRVYLGTYSREEDRLIKGVLRRGGTMVDVGANIGYMTVLGAKLVGKQGRVLSFEPNPTAFAKLIATINRNAMANCTAMQMGLSDHAGEMTLYEPPPEVHNLNSTMNPIEGTPHVVKVRTLDESLDTEKVERVDLLKIDVEGHEPFVIKGADQSLRAGRVRNLLCEFNDPWLKCAGWSAGALSELIRGYGFSFLGGVEPEMPPGSNTTHLLVLNR